MEAAADLALRVRAVANDRLARYEPLVLVAAPLLALPVARVVHAAAATFADRGIVAIAIDAVKLVPGVSSYIEAEKKKVMRGREAEREAEVRADRRR